MVDDLLVGVLEGAERGSVGALALAVALHGAVMGFAPRPLCLGTGSL